MTRFTRTLATALFALIAVGCDQTADDSSADYPVDPDDGVSTKFERVQDDDEFEDAREETDDDDDGVASLRMRPEGLAPVPPPPAEVGLECPDIDDPDVGWVTDDVDECNLVLVTCQAGWVNIPPLCGCGCMPDVEIDALQAN